MLLRTASGMPLSAVLNPSTAALSEQMKHQFEAFVAQNQLSGRAENFTALTSVSQCDVGNVSPHLGIDCDATRG
ncbi:hypothetical protein [Pseudomonas violetae]|jgi:hypothetical protein|uniref:hypothetical protein n=1 Tax=Pseudomonas violetae TaxID=2915813 RepID=UPI001FFBB683|nr:hypothetical protein [Pseudomonas violetae]